MATTTLFAVLLAFGIVGQATSENCAMGCALSCGGLRNNQNNTLSKINYTNYNCTEPAFNNGQFGHWMGMVASALNKSTAAAKCADIYTPPPLGQAKFYAKNASNNCPATIPTVSVMWRNVDYVGPVPRQPVCTSFCGHDDSLLLLHYSCFDPYGNPSCFVMPANNPQLRSGDDPSTDVLICSGLYFDNGYTRCLDYSSFLRWMAALDNQAGVVSKP